MPVTSLPPRRVRAVELLFFLLLCALIPARAPAAAKWDPVNPAELAEKKARIDPDAGAEVLYRESVVDHHWFDDMVTRHYWRIKIYSQLGIDEFAKVDLPFSNLVRISDVAARTIKPDGTILELNPKDVFDRELVAAGRARYKVKSFAPPGLEAGAILEYRYTESSREWNYFFWHAFQGKLAARRVVVRYRPMTLNVDGAYLRTLYVDFPKPPSAKRDKNDYLVFENTDLAAAREESFSPPAVNTQSSIMLYYSIGNSTKPEVYWREAAEALSNRQKGEAKPGKAIRTLVDSLVQPADLATEKLRKLYEYCLVKVKNRDREGSGFTKKQLGKLKTNETATETLKNGSGTSYDINVLFTALAAAAGLDARFALCNRRDMILFDAKITEPFVTSDQVVAIKLEGKWRFFDPGATYLPFGALDWRNSSTNVLIGDPKEGKPQEGYTETAEANVTKRHALCRLDADGTLECDVTLLYSGQPQAELKYKLDGMTAAELEKYFKDGVEENLKQAELSELKVENAKEPLGQLKISFHLHVPEYADRTGSRLFFQPALFQKNIPPVFEAASRRTDVIFHYPSTENDEVIWTLPSDWENEEGNSPGTADLGPLGMHQCEIFYTPSKHQITYKRILTQTALVVRQNAYPTLRKIFEGIRQRDAHTLTFKHRDPAAGATPAASATSDK